MFVSVLVVKTAWLYHGSIWQELKRHWDIEGFINNHWPHEKLIHSGLENRDHLLYWNHVDVRHPLKIIHSLSLCRCWKKEGEKMFPCYCFFSFSFMHMCVFKEKREWERQIKRNSALVQQPVPSTSAGDFPKMHSPSCPMPVLLPSSTDYLLFFLSANV